MGFSFGRQLLGQTGTPIAVLAVPLSADWKVGGITLDWSTVAAVSSSPATLTDGTVVPVGDKYLRYGQVLCMITNKPVQTIAETGTPTGGSFTVTGTRPDTGVTTTQTVAYNANVAAVQTAMDAIYGANNTVVSGSGALPGNTLTVTFQSALQDLTIPIMTANSSGLTGGTSPAAVIAQTVAGGNYGMFGPYDPSATDGRQTLALGQTFILNETVVENPPLGFGAFTSNHPAVFDGGVIWKDRLIATTGSHSLANGPTFAELVAVLTRLQYAQN